MPADLYLDGRKSSLCGCYFVDRSVLILQNERQNALQGMQDSGKKHYADDG